MGWRAIVKKEAGFYDRIRANEPFDDELNLPDIHPGPSRGMHPVSFDILESAALTATPSYGLIQLWPLLGCCRN